MSELNTLPGWKCVRQIGAGSFGKVYEIQHTEFGKVYKAALKVVRIPHDPSDLKRAYSEGMDREGATTYFRSFVENLTDEFAIMDEIKGFTNIVSYEDHLVIEHPNEIAWDILIRMELLTSLPDYCTNHTMSEKQTIQLGMDICNALEICEEKKIIHRDIKPDNIFVNDRGDFKLGDFGIARTVEKTMSGMSKKGTYDYMAPEVYLCRPYGQTVDIYSLGTMLYRFLNRNRLPFLPFGNLRPDDRTKALEQRMSGEMPQPPVNGSEQLKAVVMRSIAFDPKERYQTAAEFRQALKECIPFILYKGIEDAKPLDPEEQDVGSLRLEPGIITSIPAIDEQPYPIEDSKEEGTQGGDETLGGTIWGGNDQTSQETKPDSRARDGDAYKDGKTVFADQNDLLINQKKHLPKKYIAIATVIAIIAVGGGILSTRPKAVPAPVSSVSIASNPLTYRVKGTGGKLKTKNESGVDSIQFEDTDEILAVTAVPDQGYRFVQWSDGYTRAERHDELGEKSGTIYAIFEEDSASEAVSYTLHYRVSGSGGTLKGSDGQTASKLTYSVSKDDDAVTVKAVAKEGYHFTEWSDGESSETRTDKNFAKDLDVAAIFEKDADSTVGNGTTSTPTPTPTPKPTPSPSPTPTPTPTPVFSSTPTSVVENWSMSASSLGGGQVSITINSSTAVSVSAVLVYKANTDLQYKVGVIGNWTTGTYTWTASRQGPPGDYTIRFYSSSGQHMASVDVTL